MRTCQVCSRAGTHGDPDRPEISYCVEHKGDDDRFLIESTVDGKPVKRRAA